MESRIPLILKKREQTKQTKLVTGYFSPGGRIITTNVKQRVIAKLPRLYDYKGDITKQWFIEYYCLHPETGRLRRVRHYKGLSQKTVSDRKKSAYGIIARIKRKLKSGWSPFIENDILLDIDITAPAGKKKRDIYMVLQNGFEDMCVGKRKGTRKTYSGYLQHLKYFIGKNKIDYIDISQITIDDIKRFDRYLLNEQKLSNKTRNEIFSFLRKLFKSLQGNQIIINNPFEYFQKLKHNTRHGKPYQDSAKEVLKKYISENDPQLWLCIEFIFYCFIRPGELRLLQLKNINLDAGTVTIPAEISKNGKEQDVTIPMQLYEKILALRINQYPEEFYLFSVNKTPGPVPVGQKYFSKWFGKHRKKLGFNGSNKLYHWKHTGAVEATKTIKNIKDLQLQARHHSLDMFDVYLRGMKAGESADIRNNFPTI